MPELETTIELDEKKVVVEWGYWEDILIPENRTIIDTWIIDVDPEIRKKYGDDKILEECIKEEEYNGK